MASLSRQIACVGGVRRDDCARRHRRRVGLRSATSCGTTRAPDSVRSGQRLARVSAAYRLNMISAVDTGSTPTAPSAPPRWARTAAHAAALTPLPSALWRLSLVLGFSGGYTEAGRVALNIDGSGWVSLVALSVVTEAAALLTARPRPAVGGRRAEVGPADRGAAHSHETGRLERVGRRCTPHCPVDAVAVLVGHPSPRHDRHRG